MTNIVEPLSKLLNFCHNTNKIIYTIFTLVKYFSEVIDVKVIQADRKIMNKDQKLAKLIENKRKDMCKAALDFGFNHAITIQHSHELDKLLFDLSFEHTAK